MRVPPTPFLSPPGPVRAQVRALKISIPLPIKLDNSYINISPFNACNTTASVGCPDGYTSSSTVPGSCYLYSSSQVTWFAANSSCASSTNSNGWLVTINNAAENTYVSSLQPAAYLWLGAQDIAQVFTFVWQWGASTYSNWLSGEPNNLRGAEFCASVNMYGIGSWNDVSCSQTLSYVCENCMAGYAASTGPLSSCSPCPVGSYSGPGARTCIPTPAGTPSKPYLSFMHH